jgi:hypothetical protein
MTKLAGLVNMCLHMWCRYRIFIQQHCQFVPISGSDTREEVCLTGTNVAATRRTTWLETWPSWSFPLSTSSPLAFLAPTTSPSQIQERLYLTNCPLVSQTVCRIWIHMDPHWLVSWIRICIGFGNTDLDPWGQKWPIKIENDKVNSCFEVLVVLVWGLKKGFSCRLYRRLVNCNFYSK